MDKQKTILKIVCILFLNLLLYKNINAQLPCSPFYDFLEVPDDCSSNLINNYCVTEEQNGDTDPKRKHLPDAYEHQYHMGDITGEYFVEIKDENGAFIGIENIEEAGIEEVNDSLFLFFDKIPFPNNATCLEYRLAFIPDEPNVPNSFIQITICKKPKEQYLLYRSGGFMCGDVSLTDYEIIIDAPEAKDIAYYLLFNSDFSPGTPPNDISPDPDADDIDNYAVSQPSGLDLANIQDNLSGHLFLDNANREVISPIKDHWIYILGENATCSLMRIDKNGPRYHEEDTWTTRPEAELSFLDENITNLCSNDEVKVVVKLFNGYIGIKQYTYTIVNLTTSTELEPIMVESEDETVDPVYDTISITEAGDYAVKSISLYYPNRYPDSNNPCLSGDPASNTITIAESFEATITSKYFCLNDKRNCSISISGNDNYPITVTYRTPPSGSDQQHTFTEEDNTPKLVELTEAGEYFLVSAEDGENKCIANLKGTAIVGGRPTARFVDSEAKICTGQRSTVELELTGATELEVIYSFTPEGGDVEDEIIMPDIDNTYPAKDITHDFPIPAAGVYTLKRVTSLCSERNDLNDDGDSPDDVDGYIMDNKEINVSIEQPPTATFPANVNTSSCFGQPYSYTINLEGEPPFSFTFLEYENTPPYTEPLFRDVVTDYPEDTYTRNVEPITGEVKSLYFQLEYFEITDKNCSNRDFGHSGTLNLSEYDQLIPSFDIEEPKTMDICGNDTIFSIPIIIEGVDAGSTITDIYPFSTFEELNPGPDGENYYSIDTAITVTGVITLKIDSVKDDNGCVSLKTDEMTINAKEYPLAHFQDAPYLCQGNGIIIPIEKRGTTTPLFLSYTKDGEYQREENITADIFEIEDPSLSIYILDTIQTKQGDGEENCITILQDTLEVKEGPVGISINEDPPGDEICPDSIKTLMIGKDDDDTSKDIVYTWLDCSSCGDERAIILKEKDKDSTIILKAETTHTDITACIVYDTLTLTIFPKPETEDNPVFIYPEDLGEDRTTNIAFNDIISELATPLYSEINSSKFVTIKKLDPSTGELEYNAGNSTQVKQDIFTYALKMDECPAKIDTGRVVFIYPNFPQDSLLIPEGISPNEDGKNDYLKISIQREDETIIYRKDEEIPNSSIEIFNRWGEKIYEASPYRNNWGDPNIPNGIYFYIFRLPEKNLVKKSYIQIKK